MAPHVQRRQAPKDEARHETRDFDPPTPQHPQDAWPRIAGAGIIDQNAHGDSALNRVDERVGELAAGGVIVKI